MKTPNPRNLAQQAIVEYLEAMDMSRKEFAEKKCRRSLSWLHKILSGERAIGYAAALVLEHASGGTLKWDSLMRLAKRPVKEKKV